MAIAQMNWGRLRLPLSNPEMSEFAESLSEIYLLAETHTGFIWRLPDEEVTAQLQDLNFNDRVSATISVWDSVDALKAYTFDTIHGEYMERSAEWFEKVDGPQLVIWDVETTTRASFREAFERLDMLKRDGPTSAAYGWPS